MVSVCSLFLTAWGHDGIKLWMPAPEINDRSQFYAGGDCCCCTHAAWKANHRLTLIFLHLCLRHSKHVQLSAQPLRVTQTQGRSGSKLHDVSSTLLCVYATDAELTSKHFYRRCETNTTVETPHPLEHIMTWTHLLLLRNLTLSAAWHRHALAGKHRHPFRSALFMFSFVASCLRMNLLSQHTTEVIIHVMHRTRSTLQEHAFPLFQVQTLFQGESALDIIINLHPETREYCSGISSYTAHRCLQPGNTSNKAM